MPPSAASGLRAGEARTLGLMIGRWGLVCCVDVKFYH